MIHPERKQARIIDSPDRNHHFTETVYSDTTPADEAHRTMRESMAAFNPQPNPYKLYFGDLHGHTELSDGSVDVDTFFRNLRDFAMLDFCALSDHDHGGVGRPTLFYRDPETGKRKWDTILEKADQYYEPGHFTTIPAYERDSYPWFANMVLYFRSADNADILPCAQLGEITRNELLALSARDDVLFGPHTCSRIDSGCCFTDRERSLLPKTFEIYSRSGAYEYYLNPFPANSGMRGGSYIDALEQGAHPACIACSDDHSGTGGRDIKAQGREYRYTGLTGVYAECNTREAIFDAIRSRRCFAFMGEKRVSIDFRLNGHYMGEIIPDEDTKRTLWFHIDSEVAVEQVEIIKNGQSVAFYRNQDSALCFDYRAERAEDWYYLRVRLTDGRYAWTSPIWVTRTDT